MIPADWLIIADGEPLKKNTVQTLAKNKSILVLDGAVEETYRCHLTPTIVIGDFDSITPSRWEQLKKNSAIKLIQDEDQHTTDLEKGLNFLSASNPLSVTICNAIGKRLDHTLYNLRLLKRFHGKLKNLSIVTPLEKIYFCKDAKVTLTAEKKEPLSLFAFPKARAKTHGLEYELSREVLELGSRDSVSNAVLAGTASVEIQGDALLLLSHPITVTDFRCL